MNTSARDRSLTLLTMSLGFGIVQLDVTIVNTALDQIGNSLGGDISQLQWIVSSYTIAFATFILTAGTVGDRFGAKKVFAGGFGLFTLASLGCALAPGNALLIVFRGLQGLGAAALVPTSLALLNHAYDDAHERSKALGIWLAGASTALTAGPLLGGALVAAFGWRSIFFVNVPVGLIGLWLTSRYVRDTRPATRKKVDYVGQLLAIGALGALSAALIEAGPRGWRSPVVDAGFAVFGILAILFVAQEWRRESPMLPLSLFKRRMFSLTSVTGLAVNAAFYGLIFVFSLYLQRVKGWSALETGFGFLPMLTAIMAANLVSARVANVLGTLPAMAFGSGLAGVGCLLTLGLDAQTSYGALVIPWMALGFGLGSFVPPLTSTLLSSVDKNDSGVAAGVLNTTRQTGSVLGVSIFGSLIAGTDAFVPGAHTALVISACLLFATAIGALLAMPPRSKLH